MSAYAEVGTAFSERKQHPRLQLKTKANPNFRFDFIKM